MERPEKTFAELKAWLDTLSPEQLAEPVRWIGEERGGRVRYFEILDEDQVDPSGEGMEPKSGYVKFLMSEYGPGLSREQAEADADDEVVLKKGAPLLGVD